MPLIATDARPAPPATPIAPCAVTSPTGSQKRADLLDTIERFKKAEAFTEFSLWKLRADEAQWASCPLDSGVVRIPPLRAIARSTTV